MIAIAAMSKNRVIGKGGQLPWHLPADLRFFKQTTWGHIVVMGRRTFASLGRPLPGRENIVLTTQTESWPGVRVAHSLAEIPLTSPDGRHVFLIGGGQMYAALLPQCTELFLTVLEREVEGDTFFPEFEPLFGAPEICQQGEDYVIQRYRRHPDSEDSE